MEWFVTDHLRRMGKFPPVYPRPAPTPSATHSDYLIVGAGAFGTSTAYHLSRMHPAATITLLDRAPHPPRAAASTDISKVVRADYSTPFYMALADEAMRAWADTPELRGLFHRSGWLNLVPAGGRGAEAVARIRANFQARGAPDPTFDVALDEVRRLRGGVLEDAALDGVQGAYWNGEAGWVEAAAALAALGAAALRSPRVRYVVADAERVVLGEGRTVKGVRTRDGEVYTAGATLLATGAWTSALLAPTEDALGLRGAQTVESQVRAAGVCVSTFRMADAEMRALGSLPVVIYGAWGDVIPPEERSHLLKFVYGESVTNMVVTPAGRSITVPPDCDQAMVPESLKRQALRQHALLPKYTARAVESWRMCWDAISPSQDPLIAPDPEFRGLYLAVGGSFHSWKFLPTIGEYVVRVLRGESNGKEKDERWMWKKEGFEGRGAHEGAYPTRELSELHAQDAREAATNVNAKL